jgi:hypothetical protein
MPGCRRRSKSAKPAGVEEGAFGDVAPIHDRGTELVIARIDLLRELAVCAGLGDNVFADCVQSFQHGVVKFQDFDRALVPQLAQGQCIVRAELRQRARIFARGHSRDDFLVARVQAPPDGSVDAEPVPGS